MLPRKNLSAKKVERVFLFSMVEVLTDLNI